MREIKFRAWDKIEGKMWNPIIKPDGRLMADNQLGGYVTYGDPQDPLMQFTGLTDKNGKDIYEGDIVKSEYFNSSVVSYSDDSACFMICDISEDDASGCYPDNKWEVIGNIHENPELMEV